MPFDAKVVQVLIASPSDTAEARDEVEKTLHKWNAQRGKREQVILLPRRYEVDSVPLLGRGDGQSVINRQIVDDSDIVIGIFNSRLGSATPRAVSGTAEELQRSIDGGKPVHVYFSNAPVAWEDLESAKEVQEFRKSLQSQGLYGTYSDIGKLTSQIQTAIDHDIEQMDFSSQSVRNVAPTESTVARRGADPVISYEYSRESTTDNKGRTRIQTKRTRLEVTNHGDATAEEFKLKLSPVGEGELPIFIDDPSDYSPTIVGRGNFSYSIVRYAGSARKLQADMAWIEDGEQKSKTQTISL